MQPTILTSPDHVLHYLTAMCFELSTLLVSLLIGNGYDAYVVSGYASKQCCLNDQTHTNCPLNMQREFVSIQKRRKRRVFHLTFIIIP